MGAEGKVQTVAKLSNIVMNIVLQSQIVRQLITTFEKDGDMSDKSAKFFPGTQL